MEPWTVTLLVGALVKKFSLGVVGNSIAGLVGSGLGGQFLGNMFRAGLGGKIAAAGAGGGILMIIISLIKNTMAK